MSESHDSVDSSKSESEEEDIVQEARLNIILKKYSLVDIKNVRRSLNVLLFRGDLNEVVEKLKKLNRIEAHQISFCLKEYYREMLKDNNALIDEQETELIERRALKRSLRAEITELSKENFDLRTQGMTNSRVASTTSLDGVTKRTMKISDSFMFFDGKTMLITQ